MAQSQTEADSHDADDYTLDHLSALDSDEVATFVDTALQNIRGQLRSNQRSAESMGMDTDKSVSEVLDPENVEQIQVRAENFENPRVTVWLKNCPTWANDAWNDTIYPNGINAYNGKVATVFDVRPF